MRKIKYYIGATIGLIVSLSSCIKDDLTNCPANLLIKFTYETADKNWEDSELEKATVFIFDENDKFITSWSPEEALELDKIYETNLDIRTGKYHFVAWTNPVAPYLISPDLATKSRAILKLYIPSAKSVDAKELPLLLYGNQTEKLQATRDNLVEIPLLQNTNTVRISVSGLSRTDNWYKFTITDDNGSYGFDGSIVQGDIFSYITYENYPVDSDLLTSSMTILKLEADRPTPTLTIKNRDTDEQLFPTSAWTNNNLIELIKNAYPNNDFEKNHEYDIQIIFNADSSIRISINGYLLKTDPGSLVP